jgi:hypothetical protein
MMKQVMKSLVVVGAMLAAGSSVAMMDDIKPQIGIDYYQAWMKGTGRIVPNSVSNIGVHGFTPRTYPGGTVYVGTRFMEYWGAELGYDTSGKKSNRASGVATATNNTSIGAKVQRSGVHLDLLGYLALNECSNVFASLGAGWVKAKLSHVSYTTIPNAPVAATTASKSKTVFRLGVGANYMITEMIGARVKVGYETTSALRNTISIGNGIAAGSQKYFKDSTTFAAGLFAQF